MQGQRQLRAAEVDRLAALGDPRRELGYERRRHPGDGAPARSTASGPAFEAGRPAEDQPLLGAGHGDVEETALLALLGLAVLGPEGVEVQGRDAPPHSRRLSRSPRRPSAETRSTS